MIEIICKAESHNKARPSVVRRFHHWPNLGWTVEVIKKRRHGFAGQPLDKSSRPIVRGAVDRTTYQLECKLCGNAVAVRDDKLYAVFDKYREHYEDGDHIVITLDMLRRALSVTL